MNTNVKNENFQNIIKEKTIKTEGSEMTKKLGAQYAEKTKTNMIIVGERTERQENTGMIESYITPKIQKRSKSKCKHWAYKRAQHCITVLENRNNSDQKLINLTHREI